MNQDEYNELAGVLERWERRVDDEAVLVMLSHLVIEVQRARGEAMAVRVACETCGAVLYRQWHHRGPFYCHKHVWVPMNAPAAPAAATGG